jgi:hypothetical protein
MFKKIFEEMQVYIQSRNSCFHSDRKGTALFTTSRSSIPIHTAIVVVGGGSGGNNNNNKFHNFNVLAKYPQGHYRSSVGK